MWQVQIFLQMALFKVSVILYYQSETLAFEKDIDKNKKIFQNFKHLDERNYMYCLGVLIYFGPTRIVFYNSYAIIVLCITFFGWEVVCSFELRSITFKVYHTYLLKWIQRVDKLVYIRLLLKFCIFQMKITDASLFFVLSFSRGNGGWGSFEQIFPEIWKTYH